MTADAPITLAEKLGRPVPSSSPLLAKARRLGLESDGHLRQLSVNRGCRYYAEPFAFPAPSVSEEQFSNEEVAVALLHPSLPYLPQNLRVGAAMASAEGNDPLSLGTLALREGAGTALGFVAECGKKYEPGNAYWSALARVLGEPSAIPEGVMPHPTRFVAMTGITRKGVGLVIQWIRPWPVREIVGG